MNALQDMLYYTHPFPTPTTKGDKMYVIDTAYDRNSHLVGTVVDIKPGGDILNGKLWRTSTGGDYVAGHILNLIEDNASYQSMLVGLSSPEDEVFNVGRFYGRGSFPGLANSGVQYMSVSEVVTSNATYYGTTDSDRGMLTTWVKAAPWAHELMPRTEDTAATVAAKREVAEKKWKLNRAVAEMAHEGYERSWTEQLRTLHSRESLDFLPRPRLGILYEGSVLIPSGQPRTPRSDLPATVIEQMTAMEHHSVTALSNMPPTIPVQVTLPLNFELDPETMDLRDVYREMELKVRQTLDNHTIQLGHHRVSHFINGLSVLV